MKVLVIGGGPAGIMSACRASKNGHEVTLLEKRERPSRKLLITGKGRCNITNNKETVQDLIDNIPGNGNFLYSAFYQFDNHDLMSFIENDVKINLKVERGGRVFPVSDKSIDVVDGLINFAKKNKVNISTNMKVKEILVQSSKVKGVVLENGEKLFADRVILSTGGKSYPLTGSTGDGYEMLKKIGHTIIEPKPSLVPLEVREHYVKELQGLSLKNVAIKIMYENKKEIYSDFGEMLFTHFGVSGPVIISSSRHILKYVYTKEGVKKDFENKIKLFIDLKPALDFETLDNRIQRDFEKYKNKDILNGLVDLLPSRLIQVVLRQSGIEKDKKINQVTKQERMNLAKTLKKLEFTIRDFRPIDEAIVTSGGVDIDEINPSTMESKLISGLYFAGEIIDVDAYTGGFNLQIAFSTGFVAGGLQ